MAAGLERGERVALLSEGCNEWVYGELGILYAGGVNVPLSMKLTPSEVVFRVNHSEARFLMVSDYYLQVVRQVEGELKTVEKVFVLRRDGSLDGKYISFGELQEAGKQVHPEEVMLRARGVGTDDLANISYTSGTTAEPKGIMLTHGNYVSNVLQADSLIQIPPYYKVLLFLPWDHSFAHTVGIYSFMYNGASLAAVDFGKSPLEYLRNIPKNLKEVKPHLLLSVPAIAKNFRKNIEHGIREKGRLVTGLYRWGLKVAYCYYGTGNHKGKGARVLLYPLVKLADGLVFRKVRESFGGNLKFFIGGGALLDTELQRYFCALGIPMLQGYGLSEASPVISSNTPRFHRFGSSGRLVQPMDLKICGEDGEELPRGEKGEIVIRTGGGKPIGLFKEYYRDAGLTRQVWHDGVYHTGDEAWRDEDGYYWFVGRIDDVIKSSGYRIGPFEVESALMTHPAVMECAITGVPDEIRGMVVKATVVLSKAWRGREGDELVKELQNHVKHETAPYKYPRVIEFVDELPKTISGKIRRVEIREKDKRIKN